MVIRGQRKAVGFECYLENQREELSLQERKKDSGGPDTKESFLEAAGFKLTGLCRAREKSA